MVADPEKRVRHHFAQALAPFDPATPIETLLSPRFEGTAPDPATAI